MNEQNHFEQAMVSIFGDQAAEQLEAAWSSAPTPTNAVGKPLEAPPRYMVVKGKDGRWACPFCGKTYRHRGSNLETHVIYHCLRDAAIPVEEKVHFMSAMGWESSRRIYTRGWIMHVMRLSDVRTSRVFL